MQYPENSKKRNMSKRQLEYNFVNHKTTANLSYPFYVLLYLELIIFENHKNKTKTLFTRILTSGPKGVIQ